MFFDISLVFVFSLDVVREELVPLIESSINREKSLQVIPSPTSRDRYTLERAVLPQQKQDSDSKVGPRQVHLAAHHTSSIMVDLQSKSLDTSLQPHA